MAKKRSVLSNAEFAARTSGSRSLTTGKEGGKGGYYVSRDSRVPLEIGGSNEKIVPSQHVTPELVADHIREAQGISQHVMPTGWMTGRGTTPTEKENVFQGIWKNPDTGNTHLDISDRIGRTENEKSHYEAMTRALNQKQLGVYASGAGRTLPIFTVGKTLMNKLGKIIPQYGPGQEKTPIENPQIRRNLAYMDQRKAERAEWDRLTPKQQKAKFDEVSALFRAQNEGK